MMLICTCPLRDIFTTRFSMSTWLQTYDPDPPFVRRQKRDGISTVFGQWYCEYCDEYMEQDGECPYCGGLTVLGMEGRE